MRHAIKSLSSSNSQASAHVVDGKLILSLPHALTPIVWQMDLEQTKSAALEVHEGQKETFLLVLKTPGGSTTEIAPFETKAQAVSALMAVSRALENAHGKIRPQAVGAISASNEKPRGAGKWVAVALGLVMFFVLINVWTSLTPGVSAGANNTTNTVNPAAGANPAAAEGGVPLPADEILGGQ